MARTPRTIYLIRVVGVAIRTAIEEKLRDFQLTDIQYTVLSILNARDGLSSAELSRRFRVTPQSMNEMITALERKGMVSRHEDAANRRILRLALTDHGRSVLVECERRVDELESEMFSHLGEGEEAALRGALHTLMEDIRMGRFSTDTQHAMAAVTS